MNRLIDYKAFKENNFPQSIEDSLESYHGICVKCVMHPLGKYLAAGCLDGTLLVWDLATRNVIRILRRRTENDTKAPLGVGGAITCLQWFEKSHIILSASAQGSLIVWNVMEGSVLYEANFEGFGISSANFLPFQPDKVFVSFTGGKSPCLLDFTDSSKTFSILDEAQGEGGIVVCAASVTDKYVIFGDKEGYLYVIDVSRSKVEGNFSSSIVCKEKLCSASVKEICTNELQDILVNANDRCIRLLQPRHHGDSIVLETRLKLKDLVNRFHWSSIAFSGDYEYIVAGTMSKEKHNIYIWDKISGNLLKILEGPSEGLKALSWHPYRPLLASVSSYGNIYIWTSNREENWSAFAPDFKELEENLEYEEREDEFDVVLSQPLSSSLLSLNENGFELEIDIWSTIPQLQISLNDMINIPLNSINQQ